MTSLRALLLASAAAFAVSAALPAAFAQTNETDEKTDVVVITGSQVDLSRDYVGGQVARGGRAGIFGALDVMDSPFSSTNYTEELARNQQARSVADVLQNDPVVRVAKGFGNAQELYMIRGFPVYSDDMTYNGVYGILPRQFVASELLERVEVLHGANAFLNGAAPGGSGVGGAFNLVPKRAPNRDLNTLTAGWTTGGELYAAADIARRFGADKEFGARLNLAKRDGEGSVNDQDRDLSVVAAGLDYSGNQFRFAADIGYQDQHIDAPAPQVTPSGAVPTPPSADSSLAQPWTFSDEKQLFGVIRGEYDFNDAVTAWAAVGARDGEENNIFFNLNTDAAGSLSSFRFDNAREDEVVSADAGVRADFATGPVEHRVIVSGSATTLRSRNAFQYGAFGPVAGNLYNPVDIARPAIAAGSGNMSDPLMTERSETSSFAVADLLTFLDGQLIVSVGGRYQELDTRSFDYNTGATLSSYKSDAVTPALGAVYKATDQFSIYANYSEALAPSGTAPATDGGGNPVSNAGEVLSPFRGKQYEAGVKYDGGNFGGTLAAFTLTLPSAFIQNGTYGANGEQENSGIEFSVFGEPLPGFRVLGGLTLIDAELTNTVGGTLDGKQPIGVPELQANINVEWDVPMVAGLTVDGRIVHTGEQYANSANTAQLDSWTRFDLGVRYPIELAETTVTLRARLENVTDEDYWASSGGYPGANYLVLGAPRTAVVSASVDF